MMPSAVVSPTKGESSNPGAEAITIIGETDIIHIGFVTVAALTGLPAESQIYKDDGTW